MVSTTVEEDCEVIVGEGVAVLVVKKSGVSTSVTYEIVDVAVSVVSTTSVVASSTASVDASCD